MIKLDDNLLTELGLQTLPTEEKKALLKHIYETLEMRVGTTLARQMTDGQLDEFESFINNNDEAGALRWLESNFPNYKDVVAQEFEVLKSEIRQASPQILASSASQAQPMQAQAIPPQYQQPMQPQPMAQNPYQVPQPQPGFGPEQGGEYVPSQYAQPQGGYPQQPMPQQYQQPQYPQPPMPPQSYPDQTQYDQAA